MEYQNPLNNLYSTQEVDQTKEITPIQKITDDIRVKADVRTKVPLSMMPNDVTSTLSALQPDKKIKLNDFKSRFIYFQDTLDENKHSNEYEKGLSMINSTIIFK